MSDDFSRRMDDLDTELVAVQDVAFNAYWPDLAVALALIDSDVIDKQRLITIIDHLHDFVSVDAEPGRAAEAAHSLGAMRDILELPYFSSGQVLEELWKVQKGAGAEGALQLADLLSRRRRGHP